MSQNARVALWVPTAAPPQSSNDIVVSRSLPDSISAIQTAFELKPSGGGSGGGIEEAPVDGQQYARQNAAWAVVAGAGGGVEEAPSDGKPYVRLNDAWAAFDIIDAGTF